MYGLVLLRSRPDASVFTSSLVYTYCLFLQWSAFSSDSVDTCNPFNVASNSGKNVRANTIMMMIIGLLFVFASLLVVASITKHEDEAQMATEMNAAIITQEKDDGVKVNDVEEGNGNKKTAEEMHVFPITTQTIFFQILMTLSAIYYAMLLTNWGSPDYSSINNASFFATNKASYWCQLTAMWVSMGIYLYSLLAPLIFPDRFQFAS